MIVCVLMDEPLKKKKKGCDMPEGKEVNGRFFVQILQWVLC